MPQRRFRNAAASRRLGACVLLAAGSLVAVVALSEVVARVLYRPENLGTVIRFDRHLGWSLAPGTQLHSVDKGRSLDYEIYINSLGLREREFDVRKREGTRRVVFVGDSFGFGVGVEDGQRCSEFVSRALGEGQEVINASVCGWGTDQEFIYYERFVRHLDPDVVVLVFCMSNDVLNNMLDHLYLGSTPKPRYVLSDSLELVGGELERPRVALVDRARLLLRRSRLLLFVKRRLDRLREPPADVAAPDDHHTHPGYRLHDRRHGHSHWSVFERSYDADMEQAWKVTEAIIARLAQACLRDGAELVLLAFPLQVEVDAPWRHRALARAGIDEADLDLLRPFARLEAICQRLGVAYVHPLEQFREASRAHSLYLDKDVHPNVFGHAVAARALLDELSDHYGFDVHVAESDRAYIEPVHN